ncbi:ABC transporter ATP-binding protein [Aquibacillus sp. 3ASR75-11]|uniref:ABC transporter ATP-binding protein n=1 Tax=Terrihalobacillus insolitus TaxID=2950438 RepID=A0A9X4AQ13_9BACI|nr:ABC transporter ATP-binding protein [Terrihalobacillus insolitus]MDC3414523.1 ABC transporter ATP-binding protein [Terrihalobacillus insolitus]MDC3426143.1 ABC transporter ATP-binding protein [Terrihalobacillus insolitus]
MIRITELSKSFDDEKVLDNISLQIKKGSIYGLLGSNGAGKTTLLKTIAGIIKQNHGEVLVNEERIFENTEMKNRLIFIPDNPYFFSHYTVLQMANFYQDIYSTWNQDRFVKLQSMIKFDVNKKIHRFSKGMQRQVAFWLALCAMPDILILDEPFDGLDPVIRQKVKNLVIQDVAEREMTVIISSHNLREVEDLCDYIGILHNGIFVLEKELDDLKSDIHKVQIAFKDGAPTSLFDQLDILHKEKRGSVLLCIVRGKEEQVIQVIKQHKPILYDLLPLTLEEIFIYEMGGVGYAVENILV